MKINTQSLVARFVVLHGICCLTAICSSVLLPAGVTFAQATGLIAAEIASSPTLDGVADDVAWRTARPLKLDVRRVMAPNKGVKTEASIRAAYTSSHIYFLLSWKDPRADVSHKTWTWNAATGAYVEGKDREDMAALAFELNGPFTADMLSPVETTWDVWHWKALRTNPQGYAMDKTHRYFRQQPDTKANKHEANDGSDIWIARPEDSGNSVEKKQDAPAKHEGERVPQYLPGAPTGSAGDVGAKGRWADGWWSVEFARKLDTGETDDTTFSPDRCYRMAVATFDRTGDMDKASGLVVLRFDGANAVECPASQ